MKKIIIVRHGQTNANVDGITQGQIDSELNELGISQAKKTGKYINDNKKLLGDYISEEELWACTSCNACVEECPISINPLSIIMDMRRNLVMEDSSAPSELNNMMSNIENNGAPWPYNQQDRLNWNE